MLIALRGKGRTKISICLPSLRHIVFFAQCVCYVKQVNAAYLPRKALPLICLVNNAILLIQISHMLCCINISWIRGLLKDTCLRVNSERKKKHNWKCCLLFVPCQYLWCVNKSTFPFHHCGFSHWFLLHDIFNQGLTRPKIGLGVSLYLMVN